MFRRFLSRFQPMMEADGAGGGQAAAPGIPGAAASSPAAVPTGSQTPAFDYDKLAGIITGKQSVAEESVLKGYFKQQGLSQEEATQAIATFKAEKAKNQPDVAVLQQQATQAQAAAQQALVEKDATLEALTLGIDPKTIPYVLKLADLSQAVGEDGKTNTEALQNALKKVLEDVPALKPTPAQQNGFRQIGAAGSNQQQTTTDDALKAAFGL